jgi:hypothetical protein
MPGDSRQTLIDCPLLRKAPIDIPPPRLPPAQINRSPQILACDIDIHSKSQKIQAAVEVVVTILKTQLTAVDDYLQQGELVALPSVWVVGPARPIARTPSWTKPTLMKMPHDGQKPSSNGELQRGGAAMMTTMTVSSLEQRWIRTM